MPVKNFKKERLTSSGREVKKVMKTKARSEAIKVIENKDFVLDTRSAPVRYKGFSIPYNLKARWRVDGVDALVDFKEAAKRDKVYTTLRDYIDVTSSGASIRKLREFFNLTQREAGELFGGGPNAFQKYESGETEVSQAMLNLLRLIANDPDRVNELKLSQDDLPPPIPKKDKKHNYTFNLWRRKGLADSDLVLIKADGLRKHIMLVELKRKKKERDWSFMIQRMGVRHKGKIIYRQGPLDKKPVEEIVDIALEEHGLDPNRANWSDILAAVDA